MNEVYFVFGLTVFIIGVMIWVRLKKESTNLQQANRTIELAKKEWESTIDSLSDLIILTNTDANIVRCNKAVIQHLNLTYDKILGQSFYDVFAIATKKNNLIEENIKFTQHDRWFNMLSYPVYLGESLHGVVYIIKDITEQAKAKEALQNAHDELEQKVIDRTKEQTYLIKILENNNHELKDFAHNVSHELKRPIATARIMIEVLSNDCFDKLDQKKFGQIKQIIKKLDQLNNLINNIMSYSSLDWIEEEIVAIDLNKLVFSALELVSPPENIKVCIENELPSIWFEETRILQVFLNLISNAIKYNDKLKGEINIGCIKQDNYWKFWVSDNGLGIDKSNYKKIFQIFNKIENRPDSTGIGLAMVKKIIEMYEGEVWVESEIDKGSTFFFTLPD